MDKDLQNGLDLWHKLFGIENGHPLEFLEELEDVLGKDLLRVT